jgi:tetratricopeptide (TPR) repeat protein
MRASPGRVLVVAAVALAVATVAAVQAQDLLDALPLVEQGAEAAEDELTLWRLVETDRLVEARRLAEELVARDSRSYVGHFVLGWVQHYAEANFPKALFHHKEALRLYEERHGDEPRPGDPWKWHARLLRELAQTHGDLEQYGERLILIARYNELYDPDMVAERAWALMKMGHYDEARAAAREGIATGNARQEELALNALCAIEFEAGNDGASYGACRKALDHARGHGGVNAVDLTNFAEASRSVFKLDEAERVLLEATEAHVAWYGNPWMELAELYLRQGRFAEALEALRRVTQYRAQRPPHVRDADRNEARRALASFLMIAGHADEAVRITGKALVMPDRRAHNSRDPAQDRAVVALLDRRARLVHAERVREEAAAEPVWRRAWAWSRSSWLRFEAWLSGRQAARLLGDDARLVGTFRIGTAESAVMPPWLAGELVDVAGPAVVRSALALARAKEQRPGAPAYYDAFEAEAALAAGDSGRASLLADRALAALPRAEVLLRARVLAVAAESARRQGALARAADYWHQAFDADPGVMRRLGLTVPVRLTGAAGPVGDGAMAALRRSPRLEVGDEGLGVHAEVGPTGGRICLVGASQQVLGCGEAEARTGDDVDAVVGRVVRAFHTQVFAPRVDLSQADIHSLDGSNRVSRDPLRSLFDDEEAVEDDELP